MATCECGAAVRNPGCPDSARAGTRAEQEILRALREIRFGSIEVTVHDGRVVQIERKEKVRLDGDGSRR